MKSLATIFSGMALITNIFMGNAIASENVFSIKEGRIQKTAHTTFYIDGYGTIIDDFVSGNKYGSKEWPLAKMGVGHSGPAISQSEKKNTGLFQERYLTIVQAGKSSTDKLTRKILALVYEFHRKNLAKGSAPAGLESLEDLFHNLVNRTTACGSVAMATNLLLNRAGYKTRIIRISSTPDNIPQGNHISVEYFSSEQKKWILVEGMDNTVPKRAGKELSVFEVFQEKRVLDTLANGGCSGTCSPSSVVSLIFPDPTFEHAVEIYWAPSGGAVSNGKKFHQRVSANR